ncbi:MAG: hypothetical protein HYY66_09205 [Candidatus Tectomicrobia bacterium]|nr:hypothetical protein [Candidatus Tectomicrobia bacterium]
MALLNQKRAQLSKLRNEVVSLCRKLYEGKAEQACIAGLFPSAPGAPPLRKPAKPAN